MTRHAPLITILATLLLVLGQVATGGSYFS